MGLFGEDFVNDLLKKTQLEQMVSRFNVQEKPGNLENLLKEGKELVISLSR
jgi:hypothetical protein